MIIDDNILAVSNTIFRYRNNYKYVTDEMKIKYFFIFNRYFSKIYPSYAQILNTKNIDKITGMDLWYYFMQNKPYPNLFWSKDVKNKSIITTDKEIEELIFKLDIKQEDLDILMKYYPEEIKEELKYYKDLKK